MVTIRELIALSFPEVEAQRRIDKDKKVSMYYSKYPELAAIDQDLIEIRKSKMLASLDGREDFADKIGTRESALRAKRVKFLNDNGIPADFDEEEYICSKCSDTGYIEGKGGTIRVCTCKNDQLEECYERSGMRDYRSIRPDNYRADYLGDEKKRKDLMGSLLNACLGTGNSEGKNIWIYRGAPQTGKTFLAICVAKGMIKLGKSAYYCKCEAIEDMDEDLIDDLKAYDVLVIDDFAADISSRRKNAYILNTVFEIRNAAGLKTILVTYETQNDLISGCDVRIAGKLKNAGYIA